MNNVDRSLAPLSDARDILIPDDAGKDTRHRLAKYAKWLLATRRAWAMPDLHAYREHLLHEAGLSPQSVAVHLSTVRSRYRQLLLDRSLFFALIPRQMSFTEHKALVDELVARIEAAIDPRSAPVSTRTIQDRPDSEHLRLTHDQARELLAQPDTTTLAGVRDRAIIATMLCTGIREAELCGLHVADLTQSLGGQIALHVRSGKGGKERLIPYGKMDWCLKEIRYWLRRAGIDSGPVFRGLRKGDHVRKHALNERTIQKILARYPVWVDGRLTTVTPHDCRRTYARWMYDAGMKVDAIRLNMGHETIEMTFRYIGPPDVTDRLPPGVFRP